MDDFSRLIRRVSLCFAAGAVGALANSWLAWYVGGTGLPGRFGVGLTPALSAAWLYPRLVWGGLWGLVFLLPLWKHGFWVGVFSRGVLLSFFPTAFQLFYVFPFMMGKGFMGVALGKLTPVFVLFYNAFWGFCAALWLYWSKDE